MRGFHERLLSGLDYRRPVFFAYRLGWFDMGFRSARYIFLPKYRGLSGLGGNIRFYRTIMLTRCIGLCPNRHGKGVGNSGILFRHVLKTR